jgi:hypothetical protein
MLMSAAAEASVPTTEPSRSGRLLALVRKLIDYGRELAATIRQRTAADPIFAKARFGTIDLAVILARIARGLVLANALEARVLRSAAHLDAEPVPGRARSAARAPAVPRVAEAEPRLEGLPTPEQIAADARRRPIGAVIADICRDLGITGSHPLWRDVQRAIIKHGGSLARLVSDIIDQAFPRPARLLPAVTPAASRPPTLRVEASGGTGPP